MMYKNISLNSQTVSVIKHDDFCEFKESFSMDFHSSLLVTETREESFVYRFKCIMIVIHSPVFKHYFIIILTPLF